MVDLRAKPYYLNDEDIAWVENTIANMTDEEKIKTMSNFAFMGDPEQRIQLIKSDLQRLENQE